MKFSLTATAVILASAIGASARPHGNGNHVKGKWFDRFLYIVMENGDFGDVISDPYFFSFTQRPDSITHLNFTACTHPSLPNYLCGIAGTTFGVSDDAVHNLTAVTLIDLLTQKGLSWKAYMEDYPAQPPNTCYLGATPVNASGVAIPHSYVRKHNPFISFLSDGQPHEACNHIVPATEFEKDLNSGNLPQYMYYVPNLDDDGHDTEGDHDVSYPSNYLKNTWGKRFSDPRLLKNTLIQVTYDERDLYVNDYTKAPLYNQVYSVIFGGALKGKINKNNKWDFTPYSHYSTLRTLEENFGLGSLNRNDSLANVFKL